MYHAQENDNFVCIVLYELTKNIVAEYHYKINIK